MHCFLTFGAIFAALGAVNGYYQLYPTAPARYLLQNGVVPTHYDVKVLPLFLDVPGPELQLYTIPGEVRIQLQVVSPTKLIQLNIFQTNITVAGISLVHKASGTKIHIYNLSYWPEEEQVHLALSATLSPGEEFELFIPYVATFNVEGYSGFYLGSYLENGSGDYKYVASTQFQPVSARGVFPCFDEPNLKATFQLTIGRRSDFKTLSNTELRYSISDETNPNWTWDTYERTPKMSTYLLAATVTQFETESVDPTLYDKPVRVHATPSSMQQGLVTYGGRSVAQSLKYFDELFHSTKYSMPKMDSIAMPRFEGGAMENWGLNIYGESYLFYSPEDYPESRRNLVTMTTAHEVAHQWFGNLVTCKWWSDLWLNEGYARYLQYWPSRVIAPEFEPDTMFVSDVVQQALLYDQSTFSHPVKNAATTSNEIDRIFDPITYDKGASLMRMTEAFLTPEAFLEASKVYLERMQHSSAEQDDLFTILQEFGGNNLPTGLTVKAILDTWTLQSGFPVVRVYAEGADTIRLVQEPFRGVSDVANKTWHIPLRFQTSATSSSGKLKPDLWIPSSETSVTYSSGIDTSKWVVVNPDQVGFYRVWYDQPLMELLAAQLQKDHTVFSPVTRSMILDDYFNFWFEAKEPFENIKLLAGYLRNETEAVVWFPFATNFLSALYLSPCRGNPECQDFLMDKIDGALNIIGWEQPENERGLKPMLRSRLLQIACRFGHPNCLEYMSRIFDQWLETPANRSILPPDVRQLAFCSGVSRKSKTTMGWNQLNRAYNFTTHVRTKKQLERAFKGCASQPFVSGSPQLRSEDAAADILKSIAEDHPEERDRILTRLVQNYGQKLEFTDVFTLLAALAPDTVDEDISLPGHFPHFQPNQHSGYKIKNFLPSIKNHVKKMKKA